MNRRTVLGMLGSAGTLPIIGYTTRRDGTTVSVRFWRTRRAATYEGVEQRIRELLTLALDFSHWTVDVSAGGVVDVGTERAADAVTDGAWPRTVLAGAAGTTSVDPVWDVNLLVTDGRLDVAPTGYGVPHVAAVGGAARLANLDPVTSLADPVPATDEAFAAQVLLHEVGHAFGLTHDDGRHYWDGETSVVTPMLSAYGWQRDFERSPHACHSSTEISTVPEASKRRFDLRFCDCARRKLEAYDGDHLS